jgi:hypothetical protein
MRPTFRAQVVTALTRDKELLNQMFLRCGKKEFEYIKSGARHSAVRPVTDSHCPLRSLGAVMGFFFGVVQLGVWCGRLLLRLFLFCDRRARARPAGRSTAASGCSR